MNKQMYIYGASGHGKVILDCLEANGIEVKAFVDDDPDKEEFLGFSVVRSNELNGSAEQVVMGIGNNAIRKMLVEKFLFKSPVVCHSSSAISSRAEVEEGTVVFHNAVIQSGSKIGKHCIINTRASIDHDCEIGDYVHISPGSILCGNVTVGEGTWVGAGSTIIQGVTIGKNVMVGAGSVIRKNVPDNVLVVGNPARILRKL
ncbi:acetyltransferase [Marinifilum sp. D714]|uniref:acetyltransferase n=1 Tax=Marinifilum sp. D714 TaxID=2937523 RepID=UPI0027BE9AD0|nr:acetyltransferase [Marinifilum sp. D714]MDQ2178541.1 acetyltransferase [Marinifilum sp. D714]